MLSSGGREMGTGGDESEPGYNYQLQRCTLVLSNIWHEKNSCPDFVSFLQLKLQGP